MNLKRNENYIPRDCIRVNNFHGEKQKCQKKIGIKKNQLVYHGDKSKNLNIKNRN